MQARERKDNLNAEEVEIFISCIKLGAGKFESVDSFVKVYSLTNGEREFLYETEKILSKVNPSFEKSLRLDFIFGLKQPLEFEVTISQSDSENKLVGVAKCELGEIVGSRNMNLTKDFIAGKKVVGKIDIRCEKVLINDECALFQIYGKNLTNVRGFFKKSNPIFRLYKLAGESGYTKVYESLRIKNDLNPKWKEFEMRIQKLCNCDEDRTVKLEVLSLSQGKETYIGETTFTIRELKNKKLEFTLVNTQKKKTAGSIIFQKFELDKKPDFFDYLKGGLKLSLICAIDFTQSNGNPNDPDSLHCIKRDDSLNDYQIAMKMVCDVLLNYDSDKKVPMYGFGGKPKFKDYSSNTVLHCFSMTGDPNDPWVYGIEGIMSSYLLSLQNIEQSGPTLFAPLMQQAMKIAAKNKAEGSKEYAILLILTDGEIYDMEQTINCLLKCADLPLSVIIVGVGKADFTNMIVLDGDQGLKNAEGIKAERDLVQFVPFRYFANNPGLSKQILEEIPTQVVKYMEKVGIKPGVVGPLVAEEESDEKKKEQEKSDLEKYKIEPSIGNPHINYFNFLLESEKRDSLQKSLTAAVSKVNFESDDPKDKTKKALLKRSDTVF